VWNCACSRRTLDRLKPPTHTRFKVCCVSSSHEADIAVEAGACAVGLVSSMPSGPGVIADERIAEIAARVPPGIDTFLLTSLTDARAIVEQHRAARTSALQLVDRLPRSDLAEVRAALPGVRLIQVIHVLGEGAITAAEEVSGVPVVSARAEVGDAKELLGLADRVRQTLGDSVVVLGAAPGERVHLVVNVAPAVVERGVKAGDVVKAAAEVVGGGGGGRDTMAQAGGRVPEKLDDALRSARMSVEQSLS